MCPLFFASDKVTAVDQSSDLIDPSEWQSEATSRVATALGRLKPFMSSFLGLKKLFAQMKRFVFRFLPNISESITLLVFVQRARRVTWTLPRGGRHRHVPGGGGPGGEVEQRRSKSYSSVQLFFGQKVPYILRLFVKYLNDTKSNDYEQDRSVRSPAPACLKKCRLW